MADICPPGSYCVEGSTMFFIVVGAKISVAESILMCVDQDIILLPQNSEPLDRLGSPIAINVLSDFVLVHIVLSGPAPR